MRGITIILLSLLLGCEREESFKFPVLVDAPTTDTGSVTIPQMHYSESETWGIGKPGDTLVFGDLPNMINTVNPLYSKEILDSVREVNELEIHIDTSLVLYPKDPFFKFANPDYAGKNELIKVYIDSGGHQEKFSYQVAENMNIPSIPVYIYNPTNKPKRVEAQDVRLFLIQEAVDRNGKWRPIEYWANAWCGNSYYAIILPPRRYILASVICYSGDYKTSLRLKFRNGEEVYYSKPWQGSINYSQFNQDFPEAKYMYLNFLDSFVSRY